MEINRRNFLKYIALAGLSARALVPTRGSPPESEVLTDEKTYTCARWGVLDIEFPGPEGTSDPLSIQFGATFHGPRHTVMKIPGFYNGGRSFVLRFSPNEVGSWSFETHSSLPGLSGKSGTVRGVQPHRHRHGPIVVKKESPEQLCYEDGTPCSLGPLDDSTARRASSVIDVDSFKRFDRVVRHFDEQNVVAHLIVDVWSNANRPGTARADNRYFEYFIARYQAFTNVVWNVCSEEPARGTSDPEYLSERIDRLRQLDAHRRLLTVGDDSYCLQHPEKVDYISVRNWVSESYQHVSAIQLRHPHKPIFNIATLA